MKTIKKIGLLTIILALVSPLTAQQDAFSWRVGAYGGYNFYQGDLNSAVNFVQVQQPLNDPLNADYLQNLVSYGISAERSFGNFGLKALLTRGSFEANDRSRNFRNGNLMPNANLDRSLNVRTELYDASILATFYSDNGTMLSKTARVSPYFSVGFGATQFETFADLYFGDNNRYYYAADGNIYDNSALLGTPISQDGIFETSLTELQTEATDYPTLAWNIPLAIGVKFRISDRLNLNVEALGRYVFSDYLDDVSGNYPTAFDNSAQAYASNPSDNNVSQRGDANTNDRYGFVSVSLHFNFGKKTTNFTPPIFYSLGSKITTTDTAAVLQQPLIEKNTSTTPEKTKVLETDKIKANPAETPAVANEIDIAAVLEQSLNTTPTATKIEKITISAPESAKPILEPPLNAEPTAVTTEKITVLAPESAKPILEPPLSAEPTAVTTEKITVLAPESAKPATAKPPVIANRVDTVFMQPSVLNTNMNDAMLVEMEKTRCETARLEQTANRLIAQKNTNADSIAVLNQKIETLHQQSAYFEQYLNRIAIQGNNDYAQPQTQQLARSNAELRAETELLRQRYQTLVLEQQVSSAPAMTKTEVEIKVKTDNVADITSAANLKKIAALELEMTALKQQVGGTSPAALTELQRLQMTTVPDKNKTIDSLQAKVLLLEAEIEKTKVKNAVPTENFEESLAKLRQQVIALENKTAAPAPVTKTVIEKVEIPVPAPNNAAALAAAFGKVNVYFAVGSSTIRPEFMSELNRISAFIRTQPDLKLTLQGFTDKSGDPAANLRLSERRAEAVRKYLMQQGVTATQLSATFFGESQNAALNDPLARRVQISVEAQ